MVELTIGNLLDADVEALVNSVNTVGVMGKGVALQFRQAYPVNYTEYVRACKRQEVKPGEMFVVPAGTLGNPRYIINFPTKRHWRQKSLLSDIKLGLVDLVEVVKNLDIKSIALPPLGCGNGGLEWEEVRPAIEEALQTLAANVKVLLYQPVGSPDPVTMPVATSRPMMTPGRASLLGVLGNYVLPGYRLALLEIHKLAYFLQAAGQPLNLNFGKNRYGPYAENLNHVLQRMEGHFIRGYGDRTTANLGVKITLSNEAVKQAQDYLTDNPTTLERFERVRNLIEGYETPYGLELLSTVHWVATRENIFAASDPDQAIEGVHRWSKRKRELFPAAHIRLASDRLNSQGWF
jgi:O-acetyl-ADP-ribose deacetylase (regulator of RNase III)